MAKPRVFVSSTFFDLRQIRADLRSFLVNMGYEPVLAERGDIPYSSEVALEESCYREIDNCDIVVVVIGGRAGSTSQDGESTIVEKELRRALDRGKQLYVFADAAVHTEAETWLHNKELTGFRPRFAESIKVFLLLEYVKGLGINNALFKFETTDDIMSILKEQFAGLFQTLLQSRSEARIALELAQIEQVTQTLRQVVGVVSDAFKNQEETLQKVRLLNHPAFARIQEVLGAPYPIFFQQLSELRQFFAARNWTFDKAETGQLTWTLKIDIKEFWLVNVSHGLFNESGQLIVYTDEQFQQSWITKCKKSYPQPEIKAEAPVNPSATGADINNHRSPAMVTSGTTE